MKKIFLILVILTLSINNYYSQEQEPNRFQQSENVATGTSGGINGDVGENTEEGPGNPPGEDDIPINNYIPFLLISGIWIAFFYRKKIVQTK